MNFLALWKQAEKQKSIQVVLLEVVRAKVLSLESTFGDTRRK